MKKKKQGEKWRRKFTSYYKNKNVISVEGQILASKEVCNIIGLTYL